MAPPTGSIDITLRSTDIDQLGHVNQAVYHQLLEEGRVRYMVDRLGAADTGWVLARTEIDHRSEIRYRDAQVRVETRVLAVGRSSLRLAARIVTPSGTVAAEAVSVLVAFDLERRASRAIGDEERRVLEAAVVDPADPSAS
ncbi:MAG: acyl-CoA thioesterase [Solirubrobacteraceae bacterium]|nr:acyl-CoA thioesterase [Solirubrobacteraceae bacterium]